jgi:hypothetical protein
VSPVTRDGELPVIVMVVPDPEGRLKVLLQLPDGFVLMWPDGARRVAAALVGTADELDMHLAGGTPEP